MTPETATNVVNEARNALAEVKMIRADTPDRVRIAFRLGIRKQEIAELSGLARTTIDRYLGHQPKRGICHG